MQQSIPEDQPQSWIRKYYSAFDGLRALAILSVFFVHYGTMTTPHIHEWGMWMGVDVFFVLSGFLITGILCDSRPAKHYFRNFYIRRALRILPPLYGFFLAVLLLTPLLHLSYSPYVWTNLLYIPNLLTIGDHLGTHGNSTIILMGPLGRHIPGSTLSMGPWWSLCVEEQFYLIWPLVVWLVPSRVWLMRVSGTLIVLTLLLRTLLYFESSPVLLATHYLYVATYTRCDSLLVGAWLALWLREVRLSRARPCAASQPTYLGGTLACS
jgi:peptidoglycan/LPS O-acetylase OafA/YrhL